MAAGLAMAAFVGLGMAFGGVGLQDGATGRNAGMFAGTWFVAALMLAVCAGSYFAARISKFQTWRIGAAHGVVIAALVFVSMVVQLSFGVGLLGRVAGGAIQGVTNLADSAVVKDAVEDVLGDLNMRSEPQVVASGVVSRLMRGDQESAMNYLARQANISSDEARVRLADMRMRFDNAMTDARKATADALRGGGWAIFFCVLFSVVAGSVGGAVGSRVNFKKPLNREQDDALDYKSVAS